MLDLLYQGLCFDSRYQVLSTRMGVWTGKPSRYITNTKANSVFHPSV